jgi:hypothetical protein
MAVLGDLSVGLAAQDVDQVDRAEAQARCCSIR